MTLYQCIVCQQVNSSVVELHAHHVQKHTLEELSCTIINLQGFKTLNNLKHMERRSLKLGDNNNNENLYDHVSIKTREQKNDRCKEDQRIGSTILYDELQRSSHDKAECLINCSKFIAWEQELNKRMEVNDEEFFNIIDSFCSDLSRRKQKGKKRKNDTPMNCTITKDYSENIKKENITEIKDESMDGFNGFPPQPSTGFNGFPPQSSTGFFGFPPQSSTAITSSYDSEKSISNTTNDKDFFTVQVRDEENIENNSVATLTLVEIDADRQFLTYDPSDGSFSWSSIIPMNSDKKETSCNERNTNSVLQEIHENSTKNSLTST